MIPEWRQLGILQSSVTGWFDKTIRANASAKIAPYFLFINRLGEKSIFLFILIILVQYLSVLFLIVFFYLIVSKFRGNYLDRKRQRLEKVYHTSIAEYLFQEEGGGIQGFLIQQRSRFRKNILVKVISKLNEDLEGETAIKLRKLYTGLNLDRFSLKKLHRRPWNIKIAGIRELASMDIGEAANEIRRYINHPNDDLRSETQIALVRLEKEDPFRFLDTLETYFTDWEQLTVYYQAERVNIEMPSFRRWLTSSNPAVVRFSLMMIFINRQLDAAPELPGLYRHRDPEVRRLAYKITGELLQVDQASALRQIYPKETEKNKLEILRALKNIPDDSLLEFCKQIFLKHPPYALRLEVSRALMGLGEPGIRELKDITDGQFLKDPIYRHLLDKRI
ncbi:MAG: hypothetical protein IH596_14975 [Bacteroidales bacterium]|nr:hypothetical protein [Bacteroidales bacterium]